jgi:zinc transport system substrate-binding protein
MVLPVLALVAAGCGRTPVPGDRLVVAVSLAPQAFLVRTIAGGAAEVVVAVPPGADPHTYEPGPEVMRAMSVADVYLTVGMPIEEQWLPRFRAAGPGMGVLPMGTGLDLLPAGEGHEGATDPHIWMSCVNMRVMARNTAAALAAASPSDSALFMEGLARAESVIDSVETEVRTVLEGAEGASFVALHPAYGYFARDLGLVQVALEVEGDEPSPSELAGIVETARASGATALVVSPGFATGSAAALEMELGLVPAPHDQLSEDWPGAMTGLARILAGEPSR